MGAGAWFWAASLSGAELVHWNQASGTQQQWPLGTSRTDIFPAQPPSVAIMPDDSAGWIVRDTELDKVDLTSGTIEHYTIPISNDNRDMESFRPPEVKGSHSAVALALNPADSSQIAVAVSATSQVQLFDSRTLQFTTISLPQNTDARGVAFTGDGRLAVALADYARGTADTVAIRDPKNGTFTNIVVPDATALHRSTDGSIVAGTHAPSLVDSSTDTASPIGGSPSSLPTISLADGSRVIPRTTSIDRQASDGAVLSSMAYPTYPCQSNRDVGPPPAPVSSGTTSSTSGTVPGTSGGTSTCQTTPIAVSADHDGNIFIVAATDKGLELEAVQLSPSP
jgi:hypothetical protein